MHEIRDAQAFDLPGVYRVCLLADDPGWPGGNARRNPDLVGHVYAGAYVVGPGTLARVVVDEEGVAGYVLAAIDTAAFELWREAEWWPVLRRQYPIGAGAAEDRWLIERIHAPEKPPHELLGQHPAHLHIDLLPRVRGTGVGGRLMRWLLAELARRGAPGVHLGVGSDNANAIAFYEHLGFTTVADDGDTRWMVRALP
ncbi:GNAT family N-acetyltransferase [Microbacterium sp.]|uniref:GNAT family N-acetyltransferase n=1 Tax=Microbacterium sp. TaxID=51671 RepID=UPI0037C73FBE